MKTLLDILKHREIEFTDNFSISWLWKHAGMLSLYTGKSAIHFIVPLRYWKFGFSYEEYDLILKYYGLGPFLLIAVLNR